MVCLRTEFRREVMKTETNPLHNYLHGFSNSVPYVFFVVAVKATLCHRGCQLHALVALDSRQHTFAYSTCDNKN